MRGNIDHELSTLAPRDVAADLCRIFITGDPELALVCEGPLAIEYKRLVPARPPPRINARQVNGVDPALKLNDAIAVRRPDSIEYEGVIACG
jgi:hypothetical protein